MHITSLSWDDDNVDHIKSRHNVDPKEVEEACFSYKPPLILRAGRGKIIYYVLGQTDTGRYLFIVVRYQVKGKARVISARDMDKSELRLYKKRKR